MKWTRIEEDLYRSQDGVLHRRDGTVVDGPQSGKLDESKEPAKDVLEEVNESHR